MRSYCVSRPVGLVRSTRSTQKVSMASAACSAQLVLHHHLAASRPVCRCYTIWHQLCQCTALLLLCLASRKKPVQYAWPLAISHMHSLVLHCSAWAIHSCTDRISRPAVQRLFIVFTKSCRDTMLGGGSTVHAYIKRTWQIKKSNAIPT